MAWVFLDSTARSEWLAGTSQTAQLTALAAMWSGNVELRYYTSGDVLLGTATHDGWDSIDTGTDPYSRTLGALTYWDANGTGTTTYCIVAVPSGDDILRATLTAPISVIAGSRVNLDNSAGGAGLRINANGSLPVAFNVRVIIAGQSNAVGRADRSDISASPLSSDSELATYDAGTFSRVYIWNGSAYTQLQPSVFNGSTVIAGDFGPEFGIAVRWTRETTSGNLYIQKQCEGGVSITEYDPSTGSWYATLETESGQDLAWLSSNAVTIERTALLWVQGESDAAQTESWYRTKLDAMLGAMRSDGIMPSDALAVLAQMPLGSSTYSDTVFDAKAAHVAANPTTATAVQMADYLSDTIHLTARGQVQLGYDSYKAIFGGAQINV